MKEIVRLYCSDMLTVYILNSKQQVSYPVPKNMLPQDIKRRLQSPTEQNPQHVATVE